MLFSMFLGNYFKIEMYCVNLKNQHNLKYVIPNTPRQQIDII